MKKLAITTAFALTLITTAQSADARDRFTNLRPSKPTIEVNFSALRYLEPDVVIAAPIVPVQSTLPIRPEGRVTAVKRSAKPKQAPKPTPKIAEDKTVAPQAAPKFTPPPPPPPAPLPLIENTPVTPPQIIESPKRPPLEIPQFDSPQAMPEIPAPIIADPVTIAPPELPPAQQEFPKLSDITFPEPIEAPVEQPQIPDFPDFNSATTVPELPEFDSAPELPELPDFSAAPQAPASNEVVLPPLFPDDISAPQVAPNNQAPLELPPLDKAFSNDSDMIGIPELPTLDDSVFPPVPAPEISNVQINDSFPVVQAPTLSAGEMNFSVPFSETETEFPLSEQGRLDNIASAVGADPSKAVTIRGYASGTPDQTSQAKRTSLSRALSVRRYLLNNGVESSQIVVKPLGNESGNGVPDRVDIEVSQKAGA